MHVRVRQLGLVCVRVVALASAYLLVQKLVTTQRRFRYEQEEYLPEVISFGTASTGMLRAMTNLQSSPRLSKRRRDETPNRRLKRRGNDVDSSEVSSSPLPPPPPPAPPDPPPVIPPDIIGLKIKCPFDLPPTSPFDVNSNMTSILWHDSPLIRDIVPYSTDTEEKELFRESEEMSNDHSDMNSSSLCDSDSRSISELLAANPRPKRSHFETQTPNSSDIDCTEYSYDGCIEPKAQELPLWAPVLSEFRANPKALKYLKTYETTTLNEDPVATEMMVHDPILPLLYTDSGWGVLSAAALLKGRTAEKSPHTRFAVQESAVMARPPPRGDIAINTLLTSNASSLDDAKENDETSKNISFLKAWSELYPGSVPSMETTSGSFAPLPFSHFALPLKSMGGICMDPNSNFLMLVDPIQRQVFRISPTGRVSTIGGGLRTAERASGLEMDLSDILVPISSPMMRKDDYGTEMSAAVSPSSSVKKEGGPRDGLGRQAQFLTPSGITVDANGASYVCDTGARTIRKISLDLQNPQKRLYDVTTLAGSYTSSFDGTRPSLIGRIRRVSLPDGNVTTLGVRLHCSSPTPSLLRTTGITVSPIDGTIFVCSGTCVHHVHPNGTLIQTFGKKYDKYPSQSIISSPSSRWWRSHSPLREKKGEKEKTRKSTRAANADYIEHVLPPMPDLQWTTRDQFVESDNAMSSLCFLDGHASEARFVQVADVAVGRRGELYVTEFAQNVIRVLDRRRPIFNGYKQGPLEFSVWAGNGEKGWRDGMISSAHFNAPQGITTDREGNLYIAEIGTLKIRKIAQLGLLCKVSESDRVNDMLFPDKYELHGRVKKWRTEDELSRKLLRKVSRDLRRNYMSCLLVVRSRHDVFGTLNIEAKKPKLEELLLKLKRKSRRTTRGTTKTDRDISTDMSSVGGQDQKVRSCVSDEVSSIA
eukprot:jgi/Bigna1/89120/estExt_fgenesh1_pg.C_440037